MDIHVPKMTSRLDYYNHWTEIYQINEDDVQKSVLSERYSFLYLEV